MLKGTNEALYQYREKYDRSFRLSDWLGAKAANAMMCGEDGLEGAIRAAGIVAFGFPSIAADIVETSRKRKQLCAILHCSADEIAMDINELAKKQERVKYYGGDFTYCAAAPKKWLKNIQMIFGDVHLEALDEMACLGNLNSVCGGVYLSRHIDSAELERLEFVGKGVFYQNRRFSSLKEFRQSLKE